MDKHTGRIEKVKDRHFFDGESVKLTLEKGVAGSPRRKEKGITMQLAMRGAATDLEDFHTQLLNLLQATEELKKQQNSIASEDGFEAFLKLYREAYFQNDTQLPQAQGCEEPVAHYEVTRPGSFAKTHNVEAYLVDEEARADARDKLTDEGWLTSAQIATLGGYSAKNVSAQPTKWKSAGKIFSVIKRGTGYVYPRYGFDESYRPLRVMKVILDIFASHKTPWGLAEWFATPNALLAGSAPQTMLLTHPANVIQAAEYEVRRLAHGAA